MLPQAIVVIAAAAFLLIAIDPAARQTVHRCITFQGSSTTGVRFHQPPSVLQKFRDSCLVYGSPDNADRDAIADVKHSSIFASTSWFKQESSSSQYYPHHWALTSTTERISQAAATLERSGLHRPLDVALRLFASFRCFVMAGGWTRVIQSLLIGLATTMTCYKLLMKVSAYTARVESRAKPDQRWSLDRRQKSSEKMVEDSKDDHELQVTDETFTEKLPENMDQGGTSDVQAEVKQETVAATLPAETSETAPQVASQEDEKSTAERIEGGSEAGCELGGSLEAGEKPEGQETKTERKEEDKAQQCTTSKETAAASDTQSNAAARSVTTGGPRSRPTGKYDAKPTSIPKPSSPRGKPNDKLDNKTATGTRINPRMKPNSRKSGHVGGDPANVNADKGGIDYANQKTPKAALDRANQKSRNNGRDSTLPNVPNDKNVAASPLADKVEIANQNSDKAELPDPKSEKTKPLNQDIDKVESVKSHINNVEQPKGKTDKIESSNANTSKLEISKAQTDKGEPPSEKTDKIEPTNENTDKLESCKPQTDKGEPPNEKTDKIEQTNENTNKLESCKPQTEKVETPNDNSEKTESSNTKIDKTESSSQKSDNTELPTPKIDNAETHNPDTENADVIESANQKVDQAEASNQKTELKQQQAKNPAGQVPDFNGHKIGENHVTDESCEKSKCELDKAMKDQLGISPPQEPTDVPSSLASVEGVPQKDGRIPSPRKVSSKTKSEHGSPASSVEVGRNASPRKVSSKTKSENGSPASSVEVGRNASPRKVSSKTKSENGNPGSSVDPGLLSPPDAASIPGSPNATQAHLAANASPKIKPQSSGPKRSTEKAQNMAASTIPSPRKPNETVHGNKTTTARGQLASPLVKKSSPRYPNMSGDIAANQQPRGNSVTNQRKEPRSRDTTENTTGDSGISQWSTDDDTSTVSLVTERSASILTLQGSDTENEWGPPALRENTSPNNGGNATGTALSHAEIVSDSFVDEGTQTSMIHIPVKKFFTNNANGHCSQAEATKAFPGKRPTVTMNPTSEKPSIQRRPGNPIMSRSDVGKLPRPIQPAKMPERSGPANRVTGRAYNVATTTEGRARSNENLELARRLRLRKIYAEGKTGNIPVPRARKGAKTGGEQENTHGVVGSARNRRIF